MEIWASAQVPSPRSDLISQNERRGGGPCSGRRRAKVSLISIDAAWMIAYWQYAGVHGLGVYLVSRKHVAYYQRCAGGGGVPSSTSGTCARVCWLVEASPKAKSPTPVMPARVWLWTGELLPAMQRLRRLTTPACRCCCARSNAVWPSLLVRIGAAPARSSNSAQFAHPCHAAYMSGVNPFVKASKSTPCHSSRDTHCA